MQARIAGCGMAAAVLIVAGSAVLAGPAVAREPASAAAATNAAADQALSAQIVALQEAVNGVDSAGKPLLDPNYRQSALQTLTRGERFIEQKDYRQALQTLDNLSSYATSAEFRKLLKAASTLLSAQADAWQSDQVEKATRAVKEAMRAGTSADMQKAANEFNQQYDQLRRSVSGDSYTSQMLENTRNVIGIWLRVAAAEEAGNIGQALQFLSQIEGDYSSRMDLQIQQQAAAKRAALVKKMIEQPEPEADPLIAMVTEEVGRADTIEKLLNLRRRLAVLQQGGRYGGFGVPGGSSDIQNLLSDLQVIESWQAAVTAGQYNQLLANPAMWGAYLHRWKPVTARFLQQLRARALAEVTGLKDLKIADGQTPEQAVLQMARAAKSAKDWTALVACLDAYRMAAFGAQPIPAWLGDGIQGARQMVAAHRFEQAGDVERAAGAYVAILTAISEFAPVDDALAEIGRLQKDRPDILQRIRDVLPPPENAPGVTGREPPAPRPRPPVVMPVPRQDQ